MMTAIAAVFICGAAALAMDLSFGYSNKSRLHDATDAVALLIAKSELKTEADMTAAAEAYLAKTYPGKKGSRLRILGISRNGDAVNVRLADNVDTTFGSIFGKSDLDTSAQASVIYSQKSMDIALVLDTTESMDEKASGGGKKIEALRTAAINMVETVGDFENTSVRMSVVPFANHVNVGLSNRNAVWLDVPEKKDTRDETCGWRQKTETYGCETYTATCYSDGVPRSCTKKRNCKKRNVGDSYWACWKTGGVSEWKGCVGSRNEPFDERVAYDSRKIPGLRGKPCGSEILTLTDNMKTVSSTIKDLKPNGDTYMPAGLLWGWRTLDGEMPIAHSTDPKVEKVMILMTDGFNSVRKKGQTHNDKGGNNASKRAAVKSDADDKTRTLCNAVKNDKITVYTIAYEVTDANTKTLLQQCASSSSNYFDAKNAADLNKAFEEIGASLNELRITA